MTKTTERGIPLPPNIVDDLTRREFLVAAGLIALAPGCGNDRESGEDTSRETRTVEHASGTTEVPVRPALVATSFTEAATNLALLGLTPLTGPDFIREYMRSYAGFLPDSLEIGSIKLVGQITEPNLEAIAAAEPEMILAYDWAEQLYEDFSSIAPTVTIEFGANGDWRARFEREAAALGRNGRVRDVVENYEKTLSPLREATEMSVAFIRMGSEGTFRIEGIDSFPGSVMADAGVPIVEAPEGVGEDGGFGYVENISGERLTVVESDVIVVPDDTVGGFSDVPDLTAFERNPLWERLPAVRAGRVISVPGSFYNGGTYAAAQALVQAIAESLD